MTIYEMLDRIKDATEQEKLELELEILGRLLYYTGD